MNDKNETILSEVRNLSMDQGERDAIRLRLKAHIASYVPAGGGVRFWNFLSRHAIAASFAVLLMLAGGTSAVANGSRPGDLLYPIRSQVNDRLSSAMAFSEDAKFDVELRQVERDIADEEALADDMVAQETAIDDEDEAGSDADDTPRMAKTPEPTSDEEYKQLQEEADQLGHDLQQEDGYQQEQ